MPNPNVDALAAEFMTILERWFYRWQKAIAATRVANYPYQQLAADVTETWIDGTYATLYPCSLLSPISVGLKPPFPVARFVVDAAKADQAQVIAVGHVPAVTNAVPRDLNKSADAFPAANIETHLAQNGYLLVKLVNMGAIGAPPPAGLYQGPVIGMPLVVQIARIDLEWPG